MPNLELIRFVEQLSREEDIDRDVVFEALETAMMSALRKKYSDTGDVLCTLDRETGEFRATVEGKEVKPDDLGRISAQIAKQVMFQRIRESERDVIYKDYESRKGELVSGTVQRFEGQNIVVNLGKSEGLLPKTEQVREETYKVGDRIRAYITDVKKMGPKVRIIISRTHPDLVRRLFELEVPEINERIIEIVTLVREAGYRTKVAVSSYDPKVDCIGACVGVRGSRIKSIIDELSGEKIDIIRWNESAEVLIRNALKPADVAEIRLDRASKRAYVMVEDDQLSLAIGKRGQNVRLASKLVGWDIDILTRSQEQDRQVRAIADFGRLEGVTPELAQHLYTTGFFGLEDLVYRGVEHLQHVDAMGLAAATRIIDSARVLVANRSAEAASLRAAQAEAAVAENDAPSSDVALDTTTVGDTGGAPESTPEEGA